MHGPAARLDIDVLARGHETLDAVPEGSSRLFNYSFLFVIVQAHEALRLWSADLISSGMFS